MSRRPARAQTQQGTIRSIPRVRHSLCTLCATNSNSGRAAHLAARKTRENPTLVAASGRLAILRSFQQQHSHARRSSSLFLPHASCACSGTPCASPRFRAHLARRILRLRNLGFASTALCCKGDPSLRRHHHRVGVGPGAFQPLSRRGVQPGPPKSSLVPQNLWGTLFSYAFVFWGTPKALSCFPHHTPHLGGFAEVLCMHGSTERTWRVLDSPPPPRRSPR